MKRLVIALALTACGAPCQLQSAVDRWYLATGRTAPPQATFAVLAGEYHVPCGDMSSAVGCTNTETATVTVAGEAYRCDLVMLHEYGHVLGARHTDEGVMVSSMLGGGLRECITPEDVAAVCSSAGGCEWEQPECQ